MLNHSMYGTRCLLKTLSIPIEKHKGKLYFDTNQNHPFALSIRLYYQNTDLKVMYSLTDLEKQYNKNRKTIIKLLNEADVNTVRSVGKIWVYLWDFKQLKDKLGK